MWLCKANLETAKLSPLLTFECETLALASPKKHFDTSPYYIWSLDVILVQSDQLACIHLTHSKNYLQQQENPT